MALIGNYSVLMKSPGRSFGGSTVSDCRSNWSKPGSLRGRYANSVGFDAKSGVPNGYRPPGSWMIPQKAGSLAAWHQLDGSGSLTVAGTMGLGASATIDGAGDLTGTGALIVSAVATLAGTGDLTADVVGILEAAAALAGTGDISGALRALGALSVTLDGSGSLTLTSYATGELESTILPYTELSPEALATAVWSSSEGAFLYALGHNRVITDPVAGTFTVYDEDDTTPLFTADLWQDADGTTPYAGSGAERRDRLE